MLTRSLTLLSLLFAFWSYAGPSTDLFFSCLAKKDYECLCDEIDLNQDWQQQTNADGQTPLVFAINENDPDLVLYLIRKGARVAKEHVSQAMRRFFNIELSGVLPKSDSNSIELKRLILAALNGNHAKQPKQLSKIISMISSKQKIVDALLEMHKSHFITEREVNVFLREYYYLFFRNNVEDVDTLFYIVNSFNELLVDKYLLSMICRIYKNQNKNKQERAILKINNQFGIGHVEEKLAYAIIEKSRKFFHEFHVEGFFNEVNNYEYSRYLKDNIAPFEELVKFIVATITSSDRPEVIDKHYRTWLNTYRIVVDNGDFNGAFFMAKALNRSEIRSIVSREIYQHISLVTEDGGYKNYSEQIKLFKGRFYMPSIVVLIDRILKLSNLEIIDKRGNNELLNEETLRRFILLRADISKHIKYARQRRYESLPEFHYLVDHLNSDIKSKEFRKAYSLIWPRQKNNRSVSMRLDKRISIVIQNGSQTPREKKTAHMVD